MSNSEISNQLFENQLRLDRITWLAGSIEGFTDDNFFDDVMLDALNRKDCIHESISVFGNSPEWVEEEDGFLQWCASQDIFGFVVEVSTPKPVMFHRDGGYSSYGWGWTARTFLYVEQIEDAVPLAISWREHRMTKWRAEAAASDPKSIETKAKEPQS